MTRDDALDPAPGPSAWRRRWTSLGLFLLVISVYLLSNPGRIDSVDGQVRFSVSESLLHLGRPYLRDRSLWSFAGLKGRGHHFYASYGFAPSVAAIPLVAIAEHTKNPRGETSRFLFALTGGFFGAFLAPLLFWFYLELGVPWRPAVFWTLVSAFGTMVWPASTTVLDQIQHTVLVLAAVYVGYLSGKRNSPLLAASAGLLAGMLVNYKLAYGVLLPFLGLAVLWPAEGNDDRRSNLHRYLIYIAATGVGIALWMDYSIWRFGTPLPTWLLAGRPDYPSTFGNPAMGAVALLFSPGKSIFLYSPTLILALLGLKNFGKQAPTLSRAVLATSAALFLLISSLSFFHGDWCWGPRYLVPILPLLALYFPFVSWRRASRRLAGVLIGLGLIVQLLGLSIVHERFFFERNLSTFFWAGDPFFYFEHSALFSRPVELWKSLTRGVPAEATAFSPTIPPGILTGFITACPRPDQASKWMRHYKVFYLGRPWPCWMLEVNRARYPLPVPYPLALVLALVLLGLVAGVMVFMASRVRPRKEAIP